MRVGRPAIGPDRQPAFRRDWLAGVPLSDMAARFGCCRDTVERVARRLGLPRRQAHRGRPRMLDAATVRAIGERYRRGEGTLELARAFGVSRETIWRTVLREGWERRSVGWRPRAAATRYEPPDPSPTPTAWRCQACYQRSADGPMCGRCAHTLDARSAA